ncbi:MAG: ribonuclease P protein component [Patescibacteria group bacterium]|jgi:ribonuclease P protein component|nr:ribonuclease P protein component [Candidatus Absconditabacterales bacterium]MDX9778792.1 ribonuclease P protein component [Patescibacteria group bacterium]
MLPKTQKLHLDKEFDQVFQTGRSTYGRFLGVKMIKTKLPQSRFAVILGLKIEKSATKRHKLKRQIFLIVKEAQQNLSFSCDCVIIALPSIKEANFVDIKLDLLKTLAKTAKQYG